MRGSFIVLETDLEKLSFKEAIQLFRRWGFLVQHGPRTGEVTLVLEGQSHRSYCVCEAEKLPEMAVAVLAVRWHTGVMTATVRDVQ